MCDVARNQTQFYEMGDGDEMQDGNALAFFSFGSCRLTAMQQSKLRDVIIQSLAAEPCRSMCATLLLLCNFDGNYSDGPGIALLGLRV